jgi:putative cell wall-binding protein
MLLTSGTSVPAKVLAKLAALAPRHVVVVGSPTWISDRSLGQIAAVVGVDGVTRITGSSRAAASLQVAHALARRADWDGTVLVTGSITGSLMTVPVSVRRNLPLVVTDSKGISAAQVAELTSMGAERFIIVGGGVPASTLARLKSALGASAVKSILGRTIASTSEKFASWSATAYGLTWDGVGIASATNWSRTVMAALSRGRAGSVLLMTDPKKLSSEVKRALVTHHRAIKRASFVGTSSIMSIKVRSQVRLAIK